MSDPGVFPPFKSWSLGFNIRRATIKLIPNTRWNKRKFSKDGVIENSTKTAQPFLY